MRYIAVDTFDALLESQKKGPIHLKHCQAPDLKKLSRALLESIRRNDILVKNSDSDKECPLKDDSGDCVEFLTMPDKKQISVDIDRLIRHMNGAGLDAAERYSRIQERLLHEAYWLAKLDDTNGQCSRGLARLAKNTSKPDLSVLKILTGLSDSMVSKISETRPRTQNSSTQPCPDPKANDVLPGNTQTLVAGKLRKALSDRSGDAAILVGAAADLLAANLTLKYASGSLTGGSVITVTCVQNISVQSDLACAVGIPYEDGSIKAVQFKDALSVEELSKLAPPAPWNGSKTPPVLRATAVCAKLSDNKHPMAHFACSLESVDETK